MIDDIISNQINQMYFIESLIALYNLYEDNFVNKYLTQINNQHIHKNLCLFNSNFK